MRNMGNKAKHLAGVWTPIRLLRLQVSADGTRRQGRHSRDSKLRSCPARDFKKTLSWSGPAGASVVGRRVFQQPRRKWRRKNSGCERLLKKSKNNNKKKGHTHESLYLKFYAWSVFTNLLFVLAGWKKKIKSRFKRFNKYYQKRGGNILLSDTRTHTHAVVCVCVCLTKPISRTGEECQNVVTGFHFQS